MLLQVTFQELLWELRIGSESTTVVLGYGKLSQELLRVVSDLEKPCFKEPKCGREE